MTERTRRAVRTLYRAVPFKKPLYELLRRGPRLPHNLYQHLHFQGEFTVCVDPDHQFRIRSYGNQVENDLFWAGYGGNWEAMSLQIWSALCRISRGVIFDIGANSGVYALAGAAVSGSHAVAFEPVARVAERLAHNVTLNELPITVERRAVSDRSGRMPIYDTMAGHNYSASLEGQGPTAQSYEVEVSSLDEYLSSLGEPEIGPVKIDVERHEPAVLRGMKRTLKQHAPPMLIEILDTAVGQQISALLNGTDYLAFHVDEQRGLIPATDLGSLGNPNWNHLVCTKEQFDRAGLAKFLRPATSG